MCICCLHLSAVRLAGLLPSTTAVDGAGGSISLCIRESRPCIFHTR